jgi:hypothetical protein
MRSHSFLERLRESKRRRSFLFSEKGLQQRRGTNFKAELGHEFRGSQQNKEIRTVRILYSLIYCSCSDRTTARKSRQTTVLNSPYRSYGRRTAAVISGHDFPSKSYSN